MADGGGKENQDSPQVPPKRNLGDIFGGPPVPPRKFTEPDPDYHPDPDSTTKQITPEQAREILFRESAKRLAREEKEIHDLAKEVGEMSEPTPYFYVGVGSDGSYVAYDAPDILREEFHSDSIRYISLDYQARKAHRYKPPLGLTCKGKLSIEAFTDGEMRGKFLEFVQATSGQMIHPTTNYYFNENGDYGKVQGVDSRFQEGETLYNNGKYQRFIKSEMRPEDFELAGRALEILKQRLTTTLETPQSPPKTT